MASRTDSVAAGPSGNESIGKLKRKRIRYTEGGNDKFPHKPDRENRLRSGGSQSGDWKESKGSIRPQEGRNK